jgi:Uncharacterized protein conserved in bacteria (DUF2334)
MIDLRRNAALHFEGSGTSNAPRGVAQPGSVPPLPWRLAQRLAMKTGAVTFEGAWLRRLQDARRAVLGESAYGPPRFLIRVDEFPYHSAFDYPEVYGLAASKSFHDAMNGVPYLMSIVPQLTHRATDPNAHGGRSLGSAEIEFIEEMRHDRVTFAQHGTTHRTRYARRRRHSELCGLTLAETDALLERGRRALEDIGVRPRVFVPPFNRFDAAQWPVLSRRFDVVCGGPESVALMGFHGGPLWRGTAVYLPCYSPLYGNAQQALSAAQSVIRMSPGTWVPIVLHMGWEVEDGFRALRQLTQAINAYAADWHDFLGEVERSRGASETNEDP